MKKLIAVLLAVAIVNVCSPLAWAADNTAANGDTPMYPNAAGTDFVLYPAGSPSQPGRPIVDYTLGSKTGDISRGNAKGSGLEDCPIIVPRPAKSIYDPVTLTAAVDTTFSDVSTDNWAYNYIQKFVAAGYLQGDGNGLFRPDAPITYAELAAIIARIGFSPAKYGGMVGGLTSQNAYDFAFFTDARKVTDLNSQWYYPSVQIASEAGFFGSSAEIVENRKAKLMDNVQRQFAALYISNCLDLSDIPTVVPTFSDMDQIDISTQGFDDTSINLVAKPYYVPDKITAMYNAGIIHGYPDGTFNPTGTITRAEMVVMLQRVLDLYNGDIKAISDNLYVSYWKPFWAMEDELLQLTNDDRAKNGLEPVQKSANLTAEARIMSLDLGLNGSQNNNLHDTNTFGNSAMAAYAFGLGSIGQNALSGASGASGYTAFNGYLSSAPHHAQTLGQGFDWFGTGFDDQKNNFENFFTTGAQ